MNPIFNISPGDINSEHISLFGEVSNEGFSYFFLNDKSKLIEGLTVFHFDKRKTENNVSELLITIFSEQLLLKNKYSNIFISYAFNESILTPGIYYNHSQNNENINLVYGDLNNGVIFADSVEEKNLYNIYRIHADIHQAITGQFSEAKFSHQYSLLVKQLPDTGNIMKVIFYQNKIVITLLKNDKLQIVQAFYYTTAGDVVYHMVNICDQFQVEEVRVELGGMIEKDSGLFKEIHKYFLMISFSDLPDNLSYDEGIMEFPSHFFSHLFSIALCV
ncbi:MAG: DUF3822 family protein [Ginsengibacter sp.]